MTVQKNIRIPFIEVVTFSWTSRPGGEPLYGKVRQGAARQGRGPVRQIRALRRRRDPRARPSRQGRVAVVVRGPARGGAHRRPLRARGTLQALRGRAEAGRGGPLPRIRQTVRPHHADVGVSQEQGTAHGVDRRARPRPTQTGARSGSRGTEAGGGGRGRVRTAGITRGGRRAGRGGVRRRETGNGGCSPDPRRRPWRRHLERSPRRPGRGKPAWRLWRRETCRRPHPGLGTRRIRRTRWRP